MGGGGRAVSKRSGTNGADYYLQGYAVADVFAAYKMKLQYPVTLQVNVKNLFDKTYYTSSIGTNNLGNQIGDPREASSLSRIAARSAFSGLAHCSPG